jgi:hypothetical protein
MDEITCIVKDYINQNSTDYAIFINGKWGSGKTFYVKNYLIPEITKLDYSTDKEIEDKKFECLYISLFGLSGDNEFYEQLMVELNPKLKSKGLFWLNKSLKKVSGLTGIEGVNAEDAKDFISLYKIDQNKVLFFDDLERVDQNYLSKVLGLINSFVEHQHLKTIIIGDESFILNADNNFDRSSEYKKFKEKLIRFTYNFEGNITDVYNNISSSFDYKSFLQSKKDLIISAFVNGGDQNLRTLKFLLDIFQKIYNLRGLNKEDKYYGEVINRFLYFATVYSIEYKQGRVKEELDKLKNISNRFYPLLNVGLPENDNNDESVENIRPYEEVFAEKYFSDKVDYRFEFCNAIADYIHTGYLKETDLIIQSEIIVDELKRNEETRESEIISKLGNIFILEDDELNSLIEETMEKVEKGDFDLITYPNIFSFFVIFDHYQLGNVVINDELYSKFEQGIIISQKRSKYNPSFRSQIPIWSWNDRDAKSKYQKIADYAIEANETLYELNVKAHAEAIVTLFNDGKVEELYKKITNDNYGFTPIFSYISPNDFFESMVKSTNRSFSYFYSAISDRYASTTIDHKIVNELHFFSVLSNLITSYLESENSKPRTIKIVWFERLLQLVNEIYKRLEDVP